MSQRALVTVVHSHGDMTISDAIIRGVVAKEIRKIQAERDLMRLRQRDDIAVKIAAANERYAIKPESRIRRAFETVLALGVLLYEYYRGDRNVYR